MAGYCVSFLFYSYAAATVIYLLLGIFASTGNLPLLMEHYRYDDNNIVFQGDENEVQRRTYRQYYLGSSLTLLISVILYIFCMREKPQDKGLFNQTISLDMHKDNNILNQQENEDVNRPIELAQNEVINNNINNQNNNLTPQNIDTNVQNEDNNVVHAINTVNTFGSTGMGENEI